MSVINPQGTPTVPEPQDEQLPVGTIAIISVVALSLFAVGVIWATLILQRTQEEIATQSGPRRDTASEVGKPEIGMVDQFIFNREQRNRQLTQDKQERLSTAGWSSRKDNLVHIPIDQAMRAVAQGRRPSTQAPPAVEVPRNEPGARDVLGTQPMNRAPTPAGTGGDTGAPPDQQNPGASQP